MEVKTALDKPFGIHLNLCASHGETKVQSDNGARAQTRYFPACILPVPVTSPWDIQKSCLKLVPHFLPVGISDEL